MPNNNNSELNSTQPYYRNLGKFILGTMLSLIFLILGLTIKIPDKEISHCTRYVGGDAYNIIIEASLRSGEIAGAKTQQAIYIAASGLIFTLSIFKLEKNLKSKDNNDKLTIDSKKNDENITILNNSNEYNDDEKYTYSKNNSSFQENKANNDLSILQEVDVNTDKDTISAVGDNDNVLKKRLHTMEEIRKPLSPRCPICLSPKIEKLSIANRAAYGAMFGLFSKTAHSQWKCKNCGNLW